MAGSGAMSTRALAAANWVRAPGAREGIDQGMRPAVAGELPAIGDLAQGAGGRGRQLVLADPQSPCAGPRSGPQGPP